MDFAQKERFKALAKAYGRIREVCLGRVAKIIVRPLPHHQKPHKLILQTS
jgi:hypothetical protein